MTTPGNYTTNTEDMRAVHAALHSWLGGVGALVAGAGSDPAKVAIVASYCENVLEFLHVHHEGEDELIYPVLEARCPQHAELLVRIDSQHTLLVEPMSQARDAVAAWQQAPTSASADAVVAAISLVDETLRPHLAEEELEVLPIASAYIAPEEWGQLPGHALQTFAGDKPWLALGLVREALPEEHRVEMLANMPPPVRDLWTNEGSRRSPPSLARCGASPARPEDHPGVTGTSVMVLGPDAWPAGQPAVDDARSRAIGTHGFCSSLGIRPSDHLVSHPPPRK